MHLVLISTKLICIQHLFHEKPALSSYLKTRNVVYGLSGKDVLLA